MLENRTYQSDLEQLVAERTQQLSIALQDLEQSYDYTLEALGGALDAKDAETEGHCQRVTAFTITIARAMDVDKGLLRHIARGAFLHDIGKMGVPDSILTKPGPLTAEEREIMRRHCDIGYAVLERIPFLKEAAEIVLSHQECYDGSGYPRGLKGEQIPLGAQNIRGGRHAGRHDFRPPLPQGAADFRSARRNSAILGKAVRSPSGGGLHGPAGKPVARTARQNGRSLPAHAATGRLVPSRRIVPATSRYTRLPSTKENGPPTSRPVCPCLVLEQV